VHCLPFTVSHVLHNDFSHHAESIVGVDAVPVVRRNDTHREVEHGEVALHGAEAICFTRVSYKRARVVHG
jgi:hypothetical protein